MTNAPLEVSYSQVGSFRECQTKWKYQYVDRLKPRLGKPALSLGSAIHTYLEIYYKSLRSRDAHKWGLEAIEAEHGEECRIYASASMAVGDTEIAEEYMTLVDRARAICTRYYETRGKGDKKRYEVILCEAKITFPLTDGVVTPIRIDLVTSDVGGRIALWEHKSTKSIPREGRRLRDLQTTLYKAILEEALHIKPDYVVWNYLRTKTPTEPKLLQSGQLSRANLDTTWWAYVEACKKHGLNTAHYHDCMQKLEGAEERDFFPRAEMPLVQDENILLRDMIASAKHIKRQRGHLENDPNYPIVRSVDFKCDWCPYARLCEAVITGSESPGDVQRKFYTEKEKGVKEDDSYLDEFAAQLASEREQH